MKSKVVEAKKLCFSFDDKPPKLYLKGVGDHQSSVEVDPWPCYSHDKQLVNDTLEWVVSKSWDLGVKVFVGYYECTGRSNAFASYGNEYGEYDEDAGKWDVKKNTTSS